MAVIVATYSEIRRSSLPLQGWAVCGAVFRE
jgi:hypothetical protein